MSCLTLHLPEKYLIDLKIIFNLSIKWMNFNDDGGVDIRLDGRLLKQGLTDLLIDLGDGFKVVRNEFTDSQLSYHQVEALRFIAYFNPLITNNYSQESRTRQQSSKIINECFELKNEKIIYMLEQIPYSGIHT